ncbi:MAG: valine--tRNA ligase, partial [Endomicrobiales bacterium]
MTSELEKTYDPSVVEQKWYDYWQKNNLFSSLPDNGQRSFTVVIPPPNVTGSLHMGHALNATMQDIIIRFKRMRGFNTLWVPGTDHGGIATQNVVEKLLKAEGKSRHDLGREKFLERMWQWRNESGDTILMQLRRLGCSLDWSRTRFTMDEACSHAVRVAFVKLFEKGLIYRGKRLVNWCPRCHTALADIEVEHEEEIGKLWHIKYPLKSSQSFAQENEYVVVATTRPETMLGDTAVAVHPDDKRYKDMVGRTIILPLTGREIPIVADFAIDAAFGTGAVKVTPAHDPTDYEIGIRHNLEPIEVIDFHGKMTAAAGASYAGLDRYAARKKILHDLESSGMLFETVDHPHAVGHCYRCDTVIEPLLSEQWFLKVEDMSRRAMQVVIDGSVKFFPQSWANPYLLWLGNLRDWCISRQIWWGHRIPVYYCASSTNNPLSGAKNPTTDCPPVASIEPPQKCPHCGGTEMMQDPDVLDTWFSSALWPMSVLGWPDTAHNGEILKYYYPTAVLVTGHEILNLWVARMVQMGLEFMDDVPFRHVYIHGIVRDKFGKKMSKSLGNVIDPLSIMEKFGTDALRFSLTQSAAPGRDMQLSEESFVSARNFANKIWNASRFIMINVQSVQWGKDFIMSVWPLELSDEWLLSEYRSMVKEVTAALECYNMDAAARLIYDFFWSKYCDWYIELAKIRITGADEEKRKVVLSMLMEILSGVLRLLHPIMPFITEEIWSYLQELDPRSTKVSSIMMASWPEVDTSKIDDTSVTRMRALQEIITAIRTIRSEMNVPPGKLITAVVNVSSAQTRETLDHYRHYVQSLAKVETIQIGESLSRPPQSAMAVAAGIE